MHNGNGNWHEGMGGGNWGWVPMVILMVAFWAGLIWFGVTMLKGRRATHEVNASASGNPPTAAGHAPAKASAQEILAERLARGEIEPDDYRQRLEALLTHSPS